MSSKKVVLIGAGGHAKACVEIIEMTREYSVAEIVGHVPEFGLCIFGLEIKHSDADLALLRNKYDYAFIGIGQIHNPDPERKCIRSC